MTRRKALEKVRDLKTMAKEQIEAEVRKCRQQVDLAEGSLGRLEDSFRQCAADFLRKQTAGPVLARDLDLFYGYFRDLGSKIDAQKRSVQECRSDLEKNQDEMRRAFTEERLIEILHEKILRREELDAEKDAQKETDRSYLSRRKGQ